MQLTPNNHQEYKQWVTETLEDLYKLKGIELIEKSEEFFAKCYDENSKIRIKQAQKTNDEAIEKEATFLRDEIMPIINEASAKIAEKAIQKKDYSAKFSQYIRRAKVTHELFHPEIPHLEKEEEKVCTEYSKKMGSLTIEVEGKKYPITKCRKFLESHDRQKRKEAWLSTKKIILQHRDFLEDNLLRLIEIRKKMAEKAQCKDYIEYIFKKKLRDYTPKDCHEYHKAVKKYVVPEMARLQKERKKRLKVEKIHPYDGKVSMNAKYEVNPFDPQDEKKLTEGVKEAIKKISPDIASHFQEMIDNKRLDLLARENKRAGGFSIDFAFQPYAFIFMNANGTHIDLNTLAHEEGHAWHARLIRDLKYPFERDSAMEVNEVASTFLELAASAHLDSFYKEEELRWALSDQHETICESLSWVAIIDKFQHEIYSKPSLTKDDLRTTWLKVFRELRGPEENWDDDEEFEKIKYVQQLHIFLFPFYYIEYAICYITALRLLKAYEENKEEALKRYNKGLSYGNTVSVKEIYEKGFGLPLKFGDEEVKDTADFLKKKVEMLQV